MDKRRLEELKNQAILQGVPIFTHFLDLSELKVVRAMERKEQQVRMKEFCAFHEDERRMVGFFPNEFLTTIAEEHILEMFPLCIFEIKSLQKALNFNHRDVLGAILSMGIERKVVGDIIVNEDKAYFVIESLFESMMLHEFPPIKHQTFSINKLDDFQLTRHLRPKFEEIKGSLSSIRLDSVVKLCINESRTKAQILIEKGLVFINQEEICKTTRNVEENDIISIRGYGKFRLIQIGQISKKGKTAVVIYRYV